MYQSKRTVTTVSWKLAFTAAIWLIPLPALAAVPPVSIEKIDAIPDLCQSDPRGDFPNGGSEYCCIAAVSNSLMWLNANGYPNLVDEPNAVAMQVSLANRLASPDYMNTNPEEGTGTPNIMRGLKRYIEDRGYSIEHLEYQGWRRHPAEMPAGAMHPSADWIKEGISRGAVWLNVGWYKYSNAKDTYTRLSGHWVTVVGYGQTESGRPDPNTLILHDPSGRTGTSAHNEYVQAQPIQGGTLIADFSDLPKRAAGFLKLDGLQVKAGADCGIVDGAVFMVLDAPGRGRKPPVKVADTASALNQVRYHLAGPDKDLEKARELLRSLMASPASNLSAGDRCNIMVYMGYIADLQNDRKQARSWFQKAAALQGSGFEGMKKMAQSGLRDPVTYMRHLDEPEVKKKYESAPERPQVANYTDLRLIDQIGDALIYDGAPPEQTAQAVLTDEQRQRIFEDLVQAVDRYFSFFEHKQVDWPAITNKYRERLNQVRTTQPFYELLSDLVRELKDAHSWLRGYESTADLEQYAPAVSIRRIEDKPVVVQVLPGSQAWQQGIRPGWIITAINEKPADRYMQMLREHISMSSSERNYEEMVTRKILCGPQNLEITVDFLSSEDKPVNGLKLMREGSYLRSTPAPSFPLTELKYIDYGTHACGCGYIRIRTFVGRMDIADEFEQALEKLRQTKGLIIDIRDNQGGHGTCQPRIIGRLLSSKVKSVITYQRSGLGHSDFLRQQDYLSPAGDWQYKNPVGLLMNPVTGSASDYFAAQLISTGRVIPMGQTTHGNLTGKAVYVQLPCGLHVRVSTGYIADASGRIIEGYGNRPQVVIEPTIEEARQGIDGVLERAFKLIID